MDGEIHDWDKEHYVIQCKVHWINKHWELYSCLVRGRVSLIHDGIVYLNALCWMHFLSACIYVFGMEIIIVMAEMLLTHEVENISGIAKHCNKKVASHVVTRIETT